MITGLDLTPPLASDLRAQLAAALDKHLVLFFPDLDLDPARLVALTRFFGPPIEVPYIEPMPGHREVIEVRKTAAERKISNFGGDWHSDFSFLAEPPSLTLLYAVEVPPVGGDTIWCNMRCAYDSLSAGLQQALLPLSAMHSGHVYGAARPPAGINPSRSIGISRNNPDADIERAHPVVRRQPDGGQAALFVNPIYTTRFSDMTEGESAPLLDLLYRQAARPEHCCRFRWSSGTLAIWDNRATMHYALNDYDGHDRLLYRTTVAGERPVELC